MCIIAIPKLPINDWGKWSKYLDSMVANNPDGNGIIYRYDKDIFWEKGIKLHRIKEIMSAKNVADVYIHCRVASHGVIRKDMTHPFLISVTRELTTMDGILKDGEILVMQNGIFSTLPEDKIKSDTAVMCETVREYCGKIGAKNLIGLLSIISPSSKLVVASTKDGIWRTANFVKDDIGIFSNTTYIKAKKKNRCGFVGRIFI